MSGGSELIRLAVAGPAFGTEVGDFVLYEGAHEPEVAAGLFSTGKEALRISPLPSQISARCLRLA